MSEVYIEVTVMVEVARQEQIIALVTAALDIEGVEETDGYLKFYFKKEQFDEKSFAQVFEVIGIRYSLSTINNKNWNELWEQNFQPVEVEDFVRIRADFHQPNETFAHEIIITPKMSFGTGHHATTYMMLALMRAYNFESKNIIDFGTGTGILAIMAEKLNASAITAIDNDDWSIENAQENFQKNGCSKIRLIKADRFSAAGTDIILANINRNIIIENFPYMVAAMGPDSILIVSGLLKTDREDIVQLAKKNNLVVNKESEKNNWICLAFTNE